MAAFSGALFSGLAQTPRGLRSNLLAAQFACCPTTSSRCLSPQMAGSEALCHPVCTESLGITVKLRRPEKKMVTWKLG